MRGCAPIRVTVSPYSCTTRTAQREPRHTYSIPPSGAPGRGGYRPVHGRHQLHAHRCAERRVTGQARSTMQYAVHYTNECFRVSQKARSGNVLLRHAFRGRSPALELHNREGSTDAKGRRTGIGRLALWGLDSGNSTENGDTSCMWVGSKLPLYSISCF